MANFGDKYFIYIIRRYEFLIVLLDHDVQHFAIKGRIKNIGKYVDVHRVVEKFITLCERQQFNSFDLKCKNNSTYNARALQISFFLRHNVKTIT